MKSMDYLQISKETGAMLDLVGNSLFFLVIGAFAVWVFYVFFTHLKDLKSEDSLSSAPVLTDLKLKEAKAEGH